MSFVQYELSTGEPVGIQPKIWNGELMAYQRSLLNKLYRETNKKEIDKSIKELVKTTYHIENEMRKASFYKTEFDTFADFLTSFKLLSSTTEMIEETDEKGCTLHVPLNTKRSLVKSIPELRAAITCGA